MKVLLVHAKVPFEELSHKQFPLGIAYIASCIREKHIVKIFDESNENEALNDVVTEFAPDVIGVSFTAQSAIRAYEIAAQYKKSSILVAGGVHASLKPEEVLSNGFAYVMCGEGEITFSKFLDSIEEKKDVRLVPGIAYYINKKMHFTGKAAILKNLDLIPLPAHDLLKMDMYEQASIITSRSCPYHCKFCVSSILYQNCYRKRTPDNVFKEIQDIVTRYNKKIVHFCDDTFTIDRAFVKKLCELIITNELKFRWSILSRVDTIKNDRKMLSLLKKAGCELIIFGIESGSQRILDKIGKNIRISEVEDSINLCKEEGLKVKTTWIIGLPGSYNEQLDSLTLMKKILPNQISVHLFIPYPSTELYNNRTKYGIHIDEKLLADNLPYINPGYYDPNIDYSKLFSFDYLSFEQIFEIEQIFSHELRTMGYRLPHEYIYENEEKTYNSFVHKVNNKLIKTNNVGPVGSNNCLRDS